MAAVRFRCGSVLPAQHTADSHAPHFAVLEPAEQIMAMPGLRRRWTAADVRALMDETRPTPRYELIDGELLVTPSPSPVHQRAVRLLQQILGDYCLAHSLGEVFQSPADLSLDGESIVQPDLFVVPPLTTPLRRDWSLVRSILLAVEVLSPSSVRHDRVTKRRFFQRVGVPEYWIIDLEDRRVERWRPFGPYAALLDRQVSWQPSGAAAPLVIDLPNLFARIWQD
jgi:Uma2 family endonuclease